MTTLRYDQALKTYLTRPMFWWSLLLVAVVTGPQFWLISNLSSRTGPALSPIFVYAILMPTMFMGMFLGSHLKDQFASPRSRLLPGFARPHLVIAAGFLTIWAVAFPCLLALAFDISFVGSVAIGITVFTISVGFSYDLTRWFSWLFAAIFLLAFLAYNQTVEPLLAGRVPLVAWSIIAANILALRRAAVVLTSLTEEDPTYKQNTWGNVWDTRSRAGRVRQKQWESGTATGGWQRHYIRTPRSIDRLIYAEGEGLWRLVQLTRAGSPQSPVAPSLWAAAVVLIFSIVFWSGNDSSFAPMYGLFMLFPIFTLGAKMHSRRQRLASELMRPVERRRFIGAMLIGETVDFLISLAIIAAAVLFALRLLPQGLRQYWNATELIALSGVIAIALFGAVCWAASFRSMWVHQSVMYLGMMLYMMSPNFLSFRALRDSPIDPNVLMCIASAVAAIVHALAYRRWCRIELG